MKKILLGAVLGVSISLAGCSGGSGGSNGNGGSTPIVPITPPGNASPALNNITFVCYGTGSTACELEKLTWRLSGAYDHVATINYKIYPANAPGQIAGQGQATTNGLSTGVLLGSPLTGLSDQKYTVSMSALSTSGSVLGSSTMSIN